MVSPECLINLAVQACAEIKDRYTKLKINIEEEDEITKKLHTLSLLMDDMQLLRDLRDPSRSLVQALQDLYQQMKKCEEYCQPAHIVSEVRLPVGLFCLERIC